MEYRVDIRDIESALSELGGLALVRKIQDYVLKTNCMGVLPSNYKSERTFRQTVQRKIEDHCPQAAGFDAKKKEVKFVRVGPGIYQSAEFVDGSELAIAEEVSSIEGLLEGTFKLISVNSYERSAEARSECVAYHGYVCKCCGFDFEKKYGLIGKGFIHVHHIKPLSEIKGTYLVDPKIDLVPLCANCHAMVHRGGLVRSIDDLKAVMEGVGKI
jgi:predicted HNH restriction endonuclease